MRNLKNSYLTVWTLVFHTLLTHSNITAEIVNPPQGYTTQHISNGNLEKFYSVTAATAVAKETALTDSHIQTSMNSLKNCSTRNQLTIDYAAEIGPVITSLSTCYYRYPAYLWEESLCTKPNGETTVSKHLVSHWNIEQTTICPNVFKRATLVSDE